MQRESQHVGHGWPAEIRAAAVAAYRSGAESYAKVGARFGVPGATLKDWVSKAR